METVIVTQIGQAQRITPHTVTEYPTLDEVRTAYHTKKGLDITLVRSMSLTSDVLPESTAAVNAQVASWVLLLTAQIQTVRVHVWDIETVTTSGFVGLVGHQDDFDNIYYDRYTVSYEEVLVKGKKVMSVTYTLKKAKKRDNGSLRRPLRYLE